MTLAAGRILRADLAGRAVPVGSSSESGQPAGGRRMPRAVAEAHAQAKVVLTAAQRRGVALLEDAERRSADARLRAEEVGRAEGLASVVTTLIRLRQAQDRLEEDGTTRVVELAHLLAERLVGHAVTVDPAVSAGLLREVLAEARGARRVTVLVHPSLVPVLKGSLEGSDAEKRVLDVVPDPALSPGDLRLETDVGVVDARLGPSIERLASRLREMLRHG